MVIISVGLLLLGLTVGAQPRVEHPVVEDLQQAQYVTSTEILIFSVKLTDVVGEKFTTQIKKDKLR